MVGPEPLRIGEVARRSGLSVRALRHYGDLGLLVPSERTWGDHRLYSAEDLRRLLSIQNLKSIGLSLPEIQAALDEPGFSAAEALTEHLHAVDEQITRLQALRQRLTELQGTADKNWSQVLDTIELSERLNRAEVHQRISAALDTHRPEDVPVLAQHLVSDPDPGVREVLSWALAQHPERALPELIARIDDHDPAVRRQVAHTLGKLAGPQVVPGLQQLFADADPQVVASAAFGLGRTGDQRALGTLVDALGAEPAEVISTAIADFGPPALEPVEQRLSDPDPGVRERAAEILGLIGDPAAAAPLATAAGDAQLQVRFAAVLALGQLPGTQTTAAIERAARSGDDQLRLLAGRLLADRQPPHDSTGGAGRTADRAPRARSDDDPAP